MEHLGEVPDPRMLRTQRRELLDILAVALCAVIGGADHWIEVVEFGESKLAWFATFLKLPNGIASHDTFARVFRLIDTDALEQACQQWLASLVGRVQGVVAIDGKSVRGARDGKRHPLHIVSAWASHHGMLLGQVRTVKRAPLAFWVLDLWPETLQAIGVVRSPVILQAVGKLVAFIYSRCDLILAQSKSFIPQIQKYAGKDSRVEYFPSWAESVFDVQRAVPADEVPLKPGSFNVMFAGNIGDAQDFPAILAAAESLMAHAHIRWLIVGDGRMARWVADEIKRRHLQDCVLMLGRHPVERMPSFFKHANALLVSLKDEPIFSMTIPGKLQSYLAAGIPIMAMLNGEGAEVVRGSRSGLTCAAGDHAGLAAAVLKLSEMTNEERDTMGRNGLDVSGREFDRDALIDRLEGWIGQLQGDAVSPSASRGRS